MNPDALEYLDVSESGLALPLIEYLVHVKELKAASGAYNELAGIEDLSELVKLECPHNCLCSITAIAGLTNIRHMDLHDNKLQ